MSEGVDLKNNIARSADMCNSVVVVLNTLTKSFHWFSTDFAKLTLSIQNCKSKLISGPAGYLGENLGHSGRGQGRSSGEQCYLLRNTLDFVFKPKIKYTLY